MVKNNKKADNLSYRLVNYHYSIIRGVGLLTSRPNELLTGTYYQWDIRK